jgi:hypothetical protein
MIEVPSSLITLKTVFAPDESSCRVVLGCDLSTSSRGFIFGCFLVNEIDERYPVGTEYSAAPKASESQAVVY